MHTFLDEAAVFVQAGSGGDGAMHFRREKYVPLGGPDGGDGGHGGSVVLHADRGLNTLFAFKRRRRFVAESGSPGGPARMHGRSGPALVIQVPVGTVVRDQQTGELLGDLTENGRMLDIAKGGKGGLGNVHFKSSTNQAPRFAEKGEPGQERWLELELKVLADVGIIGLPNAGKSTLLSVISAARPKIADYPFTTLSPNLGVVEADDYSFVAADIPGLIEGAHLGVGLGHEFLRHIERTLVLVHVVDGSGPDPTVALDQVNAELRQYDERLFEKPQIVAVNKMDLPETLEHWPELDRTFRDKGFHPMLISAATREGLSKLVYRISDLLRTEVEILSDEQVRESPRITVPPPPDYFEVERKRKTFYVHGETVERLAVMTDMESDEAVYRLQKRLRRIGVFSALEKAGITEGTRVRIGDVDFHWDSTYEPQVKPERSAPRRES
ncbi:MAG: GTPase ObgE [Chloroflexota bacterium]|nr:MAG: GTPase ObgE [Chloroflexota bacterium]